MEGGLLTERSLTCAELERNVHIRAGGDGAYIVRMGIDYQLSSSYC